MARLSFQAKNAVFGSARPTSVIHVAPRKWSHTALFAVPDLGPPGGPDLGIVAGVAHGKYLVKLNIVVFI